MCESFQSAYSLHGSSQQGDVCLPGADRQTDPGNFLDPTVDRGIANLTAPRSPGVAMAQIERGADGTRGKQTS